MHSLSATLDTQLNSIVILFRSEDICLICPFLFWFSNIMYSRGYKNCAIVKKMVKSFPFFQGGLECKPFVLMAFMGSRNHLSCMLRTCSEQFGHVGHHRRPWCQAFFFLLKFSFKCLVKIIPDASKHFQWLIKWGLWSSKRRECQQLLLQTASSTFWRRQEPPQGDHPLEK